MLFGLRPHVAALLLGLAAFATAQTTVSIQVTGDSKPINRDLFGIFFEDINYAADAGLYAELILNRSFEYNATEQTSWNELTSCELVQCGGGKGTWYIDAGNPICANNPYYSPEPMDIQELIR